MIFTYLYFKFLIYNVGSDNYIDIRKLAFMLEKKFKINVINQKIKNLFVDNYVSNLNKPKKNLNFKIKSSSFEAVMDVINNLKKNG